GRRGVWGGGSLQEGTGGSPVTQHPTPLAGLRILDFTWVWAGPFGTRILGDLGADVIKVEQRGAGDGARWNPPFKDGQRGIDRSGLFNDLNHNKRSLTVDLKRPEGRALIERLAVEWADVLIENFGAGTLERLGLTPENLLAKQPRLIVVRLAGFGQTGPYRDYLGYAPAIHALAGLTSSIRYPDRPPIGVAIPLGDYAGGLYGVVATIATVLDRERTGRGRVVDLSQFEAAVGMVGPGLMEAAVSGREPEPRINRIDPASGAARWLVRCKPGVWQPTAQGAPAEPIDRWLALAPETDSQWAALADRVGAADRPGRDRATGAAEAAAAVYEAVSRWAAGKEVVAAASELQAEGVPAAPVQEAWELLRADPHLAARGFYVRLDHPACGEVVTSRLPVTFSATAPAIGRPAPLLGEHNTEILGGILGLTDDQIGDLVLNEVI
ncbi:MAG TPA: CoA transferase, partial [Dehalococcoidia bacterium]|nr:CoA transferase [Dehalococcoidia bacterium]